MRSYRHTRLKIVMLVLVTMLTLSVMASAAIGLSAAQPGGETVANGSEQVVNGTSNDDSTVVHPLGDSDNLELKNITWEDGYVELTIEQTGTGSDPVLITDLGSVSSGSDKVKEYDTTRYSIDGEETIRVDLAGEQEITLGTTGAYVYLSGDLGQSTVESILDRPTTELIQLAAVSGGIGAVLALMISVGALRRRHENTYKELLSDERVSINDGRATGLVGRAKQLIDDNKRLLAVILVVVAYFVAATLGVLPTPKDVWNGMSDAERVVTVGSALMLLITFLPVFGLAARLYDPQKEFVVDVDARDVLEPGLGSNGGLALDADNAEEAAEEIEELEDIEAIAVYSGAPENITSMKVDGSLAEARTAGGRGYLVEDFDPARNSAVGTWPGTASDVELISERSKIDGNREVLRDESRMLRTLIGALPAISTASDTASMRSVDKEIRELSAVDEGHINGLLDRASSGTRFEGFYDEESSDEETDYGQVVNDGSGDSETDEEDEQE